MKTIAQFLASAAKTDSEISTMRLVVLYGCFIAFTGVAVVWFVPALHGVAVNASAAFGGLATMCLGMKLGQNAQEKQQEPKQ